MVKYYLNIYLSSSIDKYINNTKLLKFLKNLKNPNFKKIHKSVGVTYFFLKSKNR